MAKKKNKKRKEVKESIFKLEAETKQTIYAIILFVLAIFFALSSMGAAGIVGNKVYAGLSFLFGVGYFLIPLLFIILSFTILNSLENSFQKNKTLGSILFFISGLGIINILEDSMGGVVGNIISYPLLRLFDFYVSLIFMIALAFVSVVIITNTKPNLNFLKFWKNKKVQEQEEFEEEEVVIKTPKEEVGEKIENKQKPIKKEAKPKEKKEEELDIKNTFSFKNFLSKKNSLPPTSLLSRDKGKPEVGDIKANANIIKRTLYNFGINVEMDEVSVGPTVTRYALKPAEGVKLSKIVGLQNDLALSLAAHPLRIEAPIPGKSLVGIEIPNKTKTRVGLYSLLSDKLFTSSDKELLYTLGRDISGSPHFENLAKAPHMLIAGATGAGKSVTVHNIIISLLYRNTPDMLKFIMVDPKRVELTLYNEIPHLLTPVITEPKKAILALKWAVKEMERRYDVLEESKVRDIASYHKNILEPATKKNTDEDMPETMPYIVVIIDELADIMQSYPRELEAGIVRLAQMSRAVGIHLILSTQRPSVNVITGLIKANVPSRLALQVSSQVDSRTILDMAGAEKLLGAGDMLYMSGDMSQPRRIQAPYVSESEVKKVVDFLKKTYEDDLPDTVDINMAEKDDKMFETILDEDGADSEDEMYGQAKQAVIEAGKASTSYIQRKLRVGYARAARLMDILEENGVVGPADGAKPREILIKNQLEDDNENTKDIESETKQTEEESADSEVKEK